jgi:hypothetical protein
VSDTAQPLTGSGLAARRVIKPVPPVDPNPSAIEIGDRARLAEEVKGSLERVQKTAENWRTGVAGLVTLVTATLLFKGQDKITAYDPSVQYILGALALLSLGLAIVSLWLFLSAAYGRTRAVSAQSILEGGGVDVRNVHLATTALDDLWWAQRWAIVSAALLAGAIALSWYGPTAASKPLAFVRVVVRGASEAQSAETLCGELIAQDGATTVLKITGEPDAQRIPTQRLVSSVLVATCWPGVAAGRPARERRFHRMESGALDPASDSASGLPSDRERRTVWPLFPWPNTASMQSTALSGHSA